jgi:cytochrome oxidase Cu insertion factor (SCO1/SenC/PrrC family)
VQRILLMIASAAVCVGLMVMVAWQLSDVGSMNTGEAGVANPAPRRTYAAERDVQASQPAAIGGAFTLVDTEGHEVNEAILKGHFSLIYFGFTSCPDICPTTLLMVTDALQRLGKLGEAVLPVFITLDPARDTPEKLKAYVTNFHPRLLALSGTDAQIAAAAKAFKVYYQLGDTSTKDYMVDHSGFIYLFDKEGKYLTHFTHQDNAEYIVTGLTRYLR